MGQDIDKDTFSHDDEKRFGKRLKSQLYALREQLNQPGFSCGPASLGAEAELYIIDNSLRPAALNTELLGAADNPLLTRELNRYNLEINLSPVAAAGRPFTALSDELDATMSALARQAESFDAQIVPIGILPTLAREHLKREYMTDTARYRALSNGLSSLKGEPFTVDINGRDALKMLSDELTLEGANTSFQVHLKVSAERFADHYNAAQLVTPLVLAIAGNSPTFLGKRLWQETRIALFKQSIDDRHPSASGWRYPSRVCFGHGWVRNGAWELFAENVALYSPLIPYTFPADTGFAELRLHHGTVWSWNRAVFDTVDDGHLRIEFRALPCGPTTKDMVANAALITGLTVAYANRINDLLPAIPFNYAEYNFYRAAKEGLTARILWPKASEHGVRESPVRDIIKQNLDVAAQGLRTLEVDSKEIEQMIRVIEQRLASGQTGAAWQLNCLAHHTSGASEKALELMLSDYLEHVRSGVPVGEW